MRDISTEDLIRTLVVKTTALERARCVAAIHPSGQLCGAVKAREREFHAAMTALKTHLREVERHITKPTVPRHLLEKTSRLNNGQINALRKAKILQPETCTIEELLRIPYIGIQAVANIATRTYNSAGRPINWKELEQ